MTDEELLHRRRFLRRAALGTAGFTTLFLNDAPSPRHNESHQNAPNNLPQATLMLIGGGYPQIELAELQKRQPNLTTHDCDPLGLFRLMMQQSPNQPPAVAFITNASRQYAEETAEQHELIFHRLGAREVHSIDTGDRARMMTDPSIADRLRRADIIFITGGDQTRLMELFRHTEAYDVLRDRYANDPGLVLAGTSAGAMVMARDMIDGNPEHPGDPTPLNRGFAFLPAIVETHMGSRTREHRLLSALSQRPGNIGIGLDNASAVIIRQGHASVHGPGRVIVATRPDTPDQDIGLEMRHQRDLATLPKCLPYKAKEMRAYQYREGDAFNLEAFAKIPAATRHQQKAATADLVFP